MKHSTHIKPMKTSLITALAIIASLNTASAAKPNAPAVKMPSSTAMRAVRTPAVNFNKPAAAPRINTPRVVAPKSPIRVPSTTFKPTPRVNPNLNNAAPRGGMNIGNIVRDVGSIRNMLPGGLRESFGMVFNKPSGPARPDLGLGVGSGGTYTPRTPKNPLDRFAQPGAGMRDLRAGASGSRKTTSPEELAADAVGTETPGGSATPVQADTDSNGTTTATSSGTDRDGNPVYVESTQTAGGNSSTTTHTTRGGVDVITTVRRDGSGHVTGSTTDSVNLANGKQVIQIRNGSGQVVDEQVRFRPGTQSMGINPSEGGSLGGPIGPRVGEAVGLKNIDLLRQQAEAQSSGGENYMTSRRIRGAEVLPASGENTSQRNTPRLKIDILNPGGGAIGGIGGGDTPN